MRSTIRNFHAGYLPEGRVQQWLRVLLAVSMGNLSYLRVWDILLPSKQQQYLLTTRAARTDLIATVTGVCFLAMLFYFGIGVLWRSRGRWARALGMLIVTGFLLLPLDFVTRASEQAVTQNFGITRTQFLAIAAGVILILGGALRQWFFAAVLFCVAILAPYSIINLGQAAVRIFAPTRSYISKPSHVGSIEPHHSKRRVIFIIFDEWDQAVSFDHRPANVHLPTIDEFVRHAVIATRAYPPAGFTLLSVPCMLSGVRFSAAQVKGADELKLKPIAANDWLDFRSIPNLITRALDRGENVVALGWYHPYDRLLPSRPNLSVRSWGFSQLQDENGTTVFQSFSRQLRFLIDPHYSATLLPRRYSEMQAAAIDAVSNAAVDLVYLHFGIPHPPGIFDAATGTFVTIKRGGLDGYTGNLRLVDRTLAELVRAVDRAGLASTTDFVLTSDHWWRTAPTIDHRVPFIVRIGSGAEGKAVEHRFCTTVIPELVRHLQEGRFLSNSDLVAWLNEQSDSVPKAYIRDGVLWGPGAR